MKLFAEQGYAAVTMRSVAAALGCSPMTPYRYFANKEALLVAVRAEAFRRFADSQEAAAACADPIARLLELKRAYIDFALAQPDAYRVMFELAQDAQVADAELERESGRAFSSLYTATREAIEAGALTGDPLSLAHLLWANTHGLVMLHLAGKLGMGRTIYELAEIALELPRRPS
ncbi:MAG TPA: TetR/AcrR family transcriptional regulator [Kofleriaceae bacterium]|nr:TetR/AcrR family transcriptional regulator [Kofleriaceae bacterium]